MKSILAALETTFVAITFAEHGMLLTEKPAGREAVSAGPIAILRQPR